MGSSGYFSRDYSMRILIGAETYMLISETFSNDDWLGFRGGLSAGAGLWHGVSRKNLAKTPLHYIEARNRKNPKRKIDFLGASGLPRWVVLRVFRFRLDVWTLQTHRIVNQTRRFQELEVRSRGSAESNCFLWCRGQRTHGLSTAGKSIDRAASRRKWLQDGIIVCR